MEQLTAVVEMEGVQKADLMSELLNAIYDIYSDASFDYDRPVFVDGGYLPVLFKLLEKVQEKIKRIDKRKAKSTRVRADEALLNLKAFIKYKREEKLSK
jgi:hypothetical protein